MTIFEVHIYKSKILRERERKKGCFLQKLGRKIFTLA